MSSKYETVKNAEGKATLRQLSTGQTMHSAIGAEAEAKAIYIEPARLRERLLDGSVRPLVLYDVGLGIGANSLLALNIARSLPAARPIHVISFENDLDGMRTALKSSQDFSFIQGWETTLEELLKTGRAEGERFSWRCYEEDFSQLSLTRLPMAEIFFCDFFNPTICPKLWGFEIFKKLRSKAAPDSILCTYSASTWVRASMLLGGFQVGFGPKTSMKMETTLASADRATLDRPLDERWWNRFNCSTKALPDDWPKDREKEAREIIRKIISHE